MRISDWSSDVCSSDLLMASLRRTVALEEVHGVAVVVAEDLHLDMARRRQAALQQDMLVAERGLGLAAHRLQRFQEIVLARHHSPALSPAPAVSLDPHLVPHPLPLRPPRPRTLLVGGVPRAHGSTAGLARATPW